MRNKFVIYCCPRSGSNALIHSLINSDVKIGLEEPFTLSDKNDKIFSENMSIDHLKSSRNLFETADGFKILHRQTEVLREICEENNAKLILLKRNDLNAQIASWIVLMTRNILPLSDSYNTWTSTGLKMKYDPDILDKRFGSFDIVLHHFMRGNHLIDNVLINYPSYLTTICYENPEPGVSVLGSYLKRDIELSIPSNKTLDNYFVNHKEFESDIKTRIQRLTNVQ